MKETLEEYNHVKKKMSGGDICFIFSTSLRIFCLSSNPPAVFFRFLPFLSSSCGGRTGKIVERYCEGSFKRFVVQT